MAGKQGVEGPKPGVTSSRLPSLLPGPARRAAPLAGATGPQFQKSKREKWRGELNEETLFKNFSPRKGTHTSILSRGRSSPNEGGQRGFPAAPHWGYPHPAPLPGPLTRILSDRDRPREHSRPGRAPSSPAPRFSSPAAPASPGPLPSRTPLRPAPPHRQTLHSSAQLAPAPTQYIGLARPAPHACAAD